MSNIIKENQIIFLESEFAKTKKEMISVHKTIVLFSIYADKDLSKLNMKHNMALKLLDPSINLEIIENKQGRKTWISYQLKKESLQKSKIKKDIFKVQKKNQTQDEQNKNISIHLVEVDNKLIRYVTIPIQNTLMSLNEINDLTQKLTKHRDDFHQAQKLYDGATRKIKSVQFEKIQKQLKKEILDKMRLKQLKIYNIESLLHFLMQKTQKISFLSIIDNQDPSRDAYKSQQEQFSSKILELQKLVHVKQNSIQFIIYNVDFANAQKNQHKSVSSILLCENDKSQIALGIHKNNILDDKYFTQSENVNVRIYQQMHGNGNNQYLSAAIQEFTKTWDNVVYLSSTPIATIVKAVLQLLQVSSTFNKAFVSQQNPDQSMNISSQSLQALTFDELFERFNIKQDLQLTENVKIEKYLTIQRLTRGVIQIQLNKGQKLVPKSIEKLIFLHYFYIMNKEFLSNYQKKQQQGYQSLLDYVNNYIVKVSQLINDINDSYLYELQGFRCKDIQKYFNFLSFLFKSLKHMKKITKRQFAICGVLKVLFQNLQPSDNVLLEYIIKNQSNIQTREAIHYYDLYLQIIKQNGQKNEAQLQYIYIKLHKLKADRIVKQFIEKPSKVTQAVRSYCQINIKYDTIPENKRTSIDKFDIQKRVARLLMTLGRTQQALIIFMKNHMILSVEKTFKLLMKLKSGDAKAEECLKMSKYFSKENAYDKAIDYCRIAYQAAKNSSLRRKAKQTQMTVVDSYMQQRLQEKKAIVRYGKNQGTQEQFNSWQNMGQDQQAKQLFKNLRNNLAWDKAKLQSEILVGNDNPDETFL